MFEDLLSDFDFDAPTVNFEYTTKEGWREFVEFEADQPVPCSTREYEAMASSDRALYNIARERFMSVGARISTPSLRSFAAAARNAMADNRSPDDSKSGVIISGRPSMGKTTAVQEFGRAFERARRARSTQKKRDLIPVAFAQVPTHATEKTMMKKLADFYALPYSQTASYETLLARVCNVMRECATEIVIIDDIHRLDLRYHANEGAADALKELSERFPGTMIYAGVDVARNGLFWGSRGEQIMARFETVQFDEYDIATNEGAAVWGRILTELETSLCLIDQPEGDILRIAAELRDISRGSLGRMAKAIRRCARDAIHDGSERLDLDNLLVVLATIRKLEDRAADEAGTGVKRRRGRRERVRQ
ncbi:putative ATP/GTP-binding protein [Leucobacter sp. 7(1)]|uniref:TniB family NTP-binding protein n=1 Tax=Leucobacter sp. 7(1) TaxID=1255613 RepID=UPI00097F3106|nr:TniB family NTP-binding protein [Leucobacter sp. 7(1)]SJN10393.1 putative ATP/GTP-binding protein [Leucobacter sp. 7(1)]